MFWAIVFVIISIILYVMSTYLKVEEIDDDPVWQTVVAVDEFCNEIARWESNLWSLWAMNVVENLLMRLDESERIPYLNKLGNQIINLQQELYKSESMSEKGPVFPYFTEDAH